MLGSRNSHNYFLTLLVLSLFIFTGSSKLTAQTIVLPQVCDCDTAFVVNDTTIIIGDDTLVIPKIVTNLIQLPNASLIEYVTENGGIDTAFITSEDINNLLTPGTDGGVYMDSTMISQAGFFDSMGIIRIINEQLDTAYVVDDSLLVIDRDTVNLAEVVDSLETVTSLSCVNDSLLIYTKENGEQDTISLNRKAESLNFRIDSATFVDDTMRIYESDQPVILEIQTFIKAAGKVAGNGTALNIFGATASKINTNNTSGGNTNGDYQITFLTPMPDNHYIIQLTMLDQNGGGSDDPGITYYDQTIAGFKVNIGDNDNGGTDRADFDSEFMFTVIDF